MCHCRQSCDYQKRTRERANKNNRLWTKNNRKKKRLADKIYKRHRRVKRSKSMSKWLTKEHKQEIKDYYQVAQMLTEVTNIQYHVDHIIPIMHDKVCGLHVPWNLQILTEQDNRTKSNKFDGTQENNSWK